MISQGRMLDVVSPVASIFPTYLVEAVDVNASLDPEYGGANCAVRAYAGGLLLRHAYPREDLYVIEFGFAPDHGEERVSENGPYLYMGHAATRFTIPGTRPMILKSYKTCELEIVSPSDEDQDFIWTGLDEGYRAYLDKAGHADIQVEASDILAILLKRIEAQATSNEQAYV